MNARIAVLRATHFDCSSRPDDLPDAAFQELPVVCAQVSIPKSLRGAHK